MIKLFRDSKNSVNHIQSSLAAMPLLSCMIRKIFVAGNLTRKFNLLLESLIEMKEGE